MRLLTRKLWRAFPELDSFTDEQCARFVHAARRGVRITCVRIVLISVASVLAVAAQFAAIYGVLWMFGFHDRPLVQSENLRDAIAGLTMLTVGVIGVGVGMLVRDVLLRRRVRWVIKAKGTCGGCGYGLLGLPVPDDLRITCPECGMEMWVDAALAELVTDDQGQRRLKPKPERRLLPRWMNRRLAWNLGKVAAVVVLLVIVGGAGWWAWRENQLVQQAKAAKAALHGFKLIQEMNESEYPAIKIGVTEAEARAADGWTHFDNAFALFDQATNTVIASPDAMKDAQGNSVLPEISFVYDMPDTTSTDEYDKERNAEFAARQEMGRRAIREFEARGGDALLRAMTDAERSVRDWSKLDQSNQATIFASLNWLGPSRRLARLCAAKMEIALEANDEAGYILALESGLKLSSMVEREPLLINRLVGNAIFSMFAERVRSHLITGARTGQRLPRGLLKAIDEAFARRRSTVSPFVATLDGEREFGRQTIAWMFSDPSRVRSVAAVNLALAGGFTSPTGLFSLQRVGSYQENLNALDAVFESAKQRMEWTEEERRASPEGDRSSLVIVGAILPGLDRALRSELSTRSELGGLTTLLAIERFRADQGRELTSLDELVPSYIQSVPTDPFTRLPLRYRQIDPRTDEFGRSYLLYSVGYDGVDNAGKTGVPTPNVSLWEILWSPKWPGMDYVFNMPR